ncbi:MAG: hypothetical protein KBT10_03390, partial [Bacteroidales bacterium]|nr:hypothetical protein [Candidatus Sodaliphilus aphodohippi]
MVTVLATTSGIVCCLLSELHLGCCHRAGGVLFLDDGHLAGLGLGNLHAQQVVVADGCNGL